MGIVTDVLATIVLSVAVVAGLVSVARVVGMVKDE